MMHKRSLKTKRYSGFALVDVIVALVIVAILAAFAVYSFIGYIGKADERRLMLGCCDGVTAAQTLSSEEYGATGKVVIRRISTSVSLPMWMTDM